VKKFDSATVWNELIAEFDAANPRGDETEAVAFLESMAQGGAALELGIGTGRIALPLSERGIRVDGIDLSPAMLAKLRSRPGGERVSVTLGDMSDVGVDGTYPLIYVVFNSLFNVPSQDGQARCFENVATHLSENGVFVVEAASPMTWFHGLRKEQYVEAEVVEVDHVVLDVLRFDSATQMLWESHVRISPKGVHMFPVVQRYSWPSELDLMARLAGLELKERWGSWTREPFTSSSPTVVSVYGHREG